MVGSRRSVVLPLAFLVAFICDGLVVASEPTVLDAFEDLTGWTAVTSKGARLEIAGDTGQTGAGMRLDFDFAAGRGFVIARKPFSLALPDNYALTFCIKGEAPVNEFEFKLIGSQGNKIWWYRQSDFGFPAEWRRVAVKKWQLQVAWGSPDGSAPGDVEAIEFAISVPKRGKGSVWIDELRLEERPTRHAHEAAPKVTASASEIGHKPGHALDRDPETSWKSGALQERQWLLVDFLAKREYGGLAIDWEQDDYAIAYEVQVSDDGTSWAPAHTVRTGNGGRDYAYMPDAESRYVRLDLQQSSRGKGYGIRTITVKPSEFSASINRFFTAIARDAPRGLYPKYFHGEQTYWTLIGVAGDDKEGLLNEEGAVEVDKGAFTIEPFLYADGRLITWDVVERVQELAKDYLPVPSVTWRHGPLALRVTAFATGESGASTLYARYRIENSGGESLTVSLFLAIRPFQVSPPWQALNMLGGVSPIHEIKYEGQSVLVDGSRAVVSLTRPERFGAATFDQGPVTEYLLRNEVPPQTTVSDPFGYASGALEYRLDVPGKSAKDVYVAIPFHGLDLESPTGGEAIDLANLGPAELEEAKRLWEEELDVAEIRLPPEADRITRTLKSTLAYILINRDGPAIQPGSRCYSRSWIRDGALTSAALLGVGHTREVREFIEWFARFQFQDGKIPCCVDGRGPDAVPENDSNGEFIYAVMEYYRYTRDVGFLRKMWPHVLKAVEFIDAMRRQRTTDAYTTPEMLPFYGLVPESISHEGYSSHPVHSYWDDFFVLRGLKDAASMALVLGDQERAVSFAELRNGFRNDLYASISRTMAKHGIDYIPGSVELGDFDPTSTTVAVAPGGELESLPEPALTRTFEYYYTGFLQRRNGDNDWWAYTPYELRTVGTFVELGQRERALEILDFFFADQRPAPWNQWAEVVWRDPMAPRFIGDMPHTWVGSDYIRAVRSLFAFERESDRALVIAAGIPRQWVESDAGVSVKRLPTYYGTLGYSLRSQGPNELRLSLSGDLSLPPGKIVVKPPLVQSLTAVTVNGKPVDTFDAESAVIAEFPADVVLQ